MKCLERLSVTIHGVSNLRLFVGPKALNVLESVRSNTAPGQMNGPDLSKVVDFGFFSLIARPLFQWLVWTHQHMASNWGVSYRHPDDLHQPGPAPVAYHQHEIGAEDAEASAADEGDPGEI